MITERYHAALARLNIEPNYKTMTAEMAAQRALDRLIVMGVFK